MSLLNDAYFLNEESTEEDLQKWEEHVKLASPVIKKLDAYLAKEVRSVERSMRLDSVLSTPQPGTSLLVLQAKKEALEILRNLFDI